MKQRGIDMRQTIRSELCCLILYEDFAFSVKELINVIMLTTFLTLLHPLRNSLTQANITRKETKNYSKITPTIVKINFSDVPVICNFPSLVHQKLKIFIQSTLS